MLNKKTGLIEKIIYHIFRILVGIIRFMHSADKIFNPQSLYFILRVGSGGVYALAVPQCNNKAVNVWSQTLGLFIYILSLFFECKDFCCHRFKSFTQNPLSIETQTYTLNQNFIIEFLVLVQFKVNIVEYMDQPFEKTPKMSIKRFMYK